MEIGVIGLGRMGSAIAANLIAAGHEVTVYNRSPEKAEPLLKKGATLAHDPAGAANGDIVMTMLANDEALGEVVLGENGFLAHQGEDTVHVSLSTISVHLSKLLAQASAAKKRSYIAATVMGRPDVAERGELIIMAAGERSAVKKCKPAFEAIGKHIHVLGDEPHQANIVKLTANFMLSSMIETMSEAFALLRKNDIDHFEFLKIMGSEFFQSPLYEKYGKIIAGENFGSEAFTVKGQEKDTRLALEAAIESQVPMPILNAIETAFLSAIGRGKGEMDPCALALIALENAGVKSKVKK